MGFGRKKDGMKVIQESVDQFQGIIDNLDKGICLCEDEVSDNEETIQSLTDKNKTIDKSKGKATIFRDNLHGMLNSPIPEEKKED